MTQDGGWIVRPLGATCGVGTLFRRRSGHCHSFSGLLGALWFPSLPALAACLVYLTSPPQDLCLPIVKFTGMSVSSCCLKPIHGSPFPTAQSLDSVADTQAHLFWRLHLLTVALHYWVTDGLPFLDGACRFLHGTLAADRCALPHCSGNTPHGTFPDSSPCWCSFLPSVNSVPRSLSWTPVREQFPVFVVRQPFIPAFPCLTVGVQ